MNESACGDIGYEWEDQNCTEVEECTTGCCCDNTGGWSFIAQASCDEESDDTSKFVPANEDDDCITACSDSEETYTIDVVVEGPDGSPLAGVNVTLDVPSIKKETGPDGTLTFNDVEPGGKILKADNGTCTQTEHPYVNQDLDYTITLNCTAGGGEDACTPDWECGYDDDTECGRRYDYCNDASDCTDYSYQDYYEEVHGETKPLPFNPCPVTPDTCNDDGTLDEGEACDGDEYRDGKDACEDYGYDGGDLSCNDCRVDLSGCDACPQSDPDYCTETQCNECEVCEDVCGQTECLETSPEIQSIRYPEETDEAIVTWTFDQECYDAIRSFTIRIEDDSEPYKDIVIPNTDNDVFTGGATSTFSYDEISGLDEDTNYCYTVEASLQENGQEDTTTSDEECSKTGDEECMQPHPDEFCIGDVRNRCDDHNNLDPFKDCAEENQLCFGPDAQEKTACSDKTVCQLCNGLFGMYGYLTPQGRTFEVPFLRPDADETLSTDCDDYRIYPQGGDDLPACRDDRTRTATDELDTCGNVHTCYDYTTKGSCTDNQCNKEGLENCEWQPFPEESDELGLGVCKPAEGAPACSRCNEDDHVLPACTEQLCGLYATGTNPDEKCYYSGDGSGGACLSKAEASCESYNNKQDCTGSQTYELNITYSTEEGYESKPVGGTHERTSLTEDPFAFGVCEWDQEEQSCVKNADHYEETDCTPKTRRSYPDCVRDTEQPETHVDFLTPSDQPWNLEHPVYSAHNLFTFRASDNLFPQKEIDTYISYNETGHDYPDLEADNFENAYAQDLDGTYNLAYYSKDASQNLEEVQTHTVTFDNTPPELESIGNETTPYLIAEDEWRTNLTITYTVKEPHGPITCEGRLYSDGQTDLGGDRTYHASQASGSVEFTQDYHQLPDSTYTFKLTCTDHESLNNSETYTHDITIEADKSITDPQPHREVYPGDTTNVTISIETPRKQAECRFSKQHDEPATQETGAEEFTTEDGHHHEYTLEDLEPGLYYYHTGCEFEDGKVTEGNGGDMILFSIDDTPPATTLWDDYHDEPFGPSYWNDTRQLSLAAEDKDPSLQLQTVDGEVLWDGNAGETTTHYCFNYNPQPGSCEFEAYEEPFRLTADDRPGTHIHFYSQDRHGNEEEENVESLWLRDLQVYLQGVEICTSEGECFYPQTQPE